MRYKVLVEIFDVSVPVRTGMPVYPGDPVVFLDEEAHKVLLEAGVVVVEGLELSAVEPGTYELYCLPLKLVGSDGAPARAILVRR